MKPFVLILAGALLGGSLLAQRHRLGQINTETEEGKLLQAIGSEEDAGRKLQLMESFVQKHEKHEASGWVWAQLQSAYLKANNHDKALQAGEQLLARDAMDLEAAYANLKASEGRKDADGVIKWAVTTSEIAGKTAAAPKKEDEEEE